MMLFLIAVLRAIIEMLGLCLIAQGVLHLVAGPKRANNPIYQLFALITRAPRQMVRKLLPAGASPAAVAIILFVTLLAGWIGLALLRKIV